MSNMERPLLGAKRPFMVEHFFSSLHDIAIDAAKGFYDVAAELFFERDTDDERQRRRRIYNAE
jgi:hypothetical protein